MPGAAENLSYQQPFYLRVNVWRNLDGTKFKMHPVGRDDLQWLVPDARASVRVHRPGEPP